MNRHRFNSDMEAAWELRPQTDNTPETRSHARRFNQNKTTEQEQAEVQQKIEDHKEIK